MLNVGCCCLKCRVHTLRNMFSFSVVFSRSVSIDRVTEVHRSNTDQLVESGLFAAALNLVVRNSLLDVGFEPL